MNREGFTIVGAVQLLKRLLVGIYWICTNTACIFHREVCVSSGSKGAVERLEDWKFVLCKYDQMIVHIADKDNLWKFQSS